METYFEAGRELPVAGEYDVIVAGSGPAGSSAAVTAGRLGARVLLIEWNNAVGGMSTSGLMSHWTGTVSSPLYTEILRRSGEKNEGDEFIQSLRCSNIYVPDTKEVTEKYRKQATDQGIDTEWIEKYMPAVGEKDETL